ncbi:uncharacterized protein PRCAT00000455001 [Priceomyces carsonii]|uniref:uncharacterized protein n=1 Tax=Priceomyces carsonii TaxID=28549 RepID=UPI002EDAD186|nr:unnamed protein product [Priceomyces carsonii]
MTRCRVSSDTAKGSSSNFDKEKLIAFLNRLSYSLDSRFIIINEIVDTVELGLPEKVSVSQLFDLTAEVIASKVIYHPDFATLAGRVEAARLQKKIRLSFSKNVERLHNNSFEGGNRGKTPISDSFYETVMKNRDFLDKIIVSDRDFELSYFGIKTLQKSYLLRLGEEVAETPQYMFLRVAVGIHCDNLNDIVETYDLMSKKYFIHASPTLYNSGTVKNYLSSCFLVAMDDDSIDGIYKTLHKVALISKASGGVGLHVSNIRASGSHISSSNGISSGLVPMLRVFNNTAKYVDQGGNKRPGAFAIYLEPWHGDIFEFLNLKKNHGKEEMRARDLFYGLWIPDLFMKRVKNNSTWSLFSPDVAPNLADNYGKDFDDLYEKYEKEGLAMRTVSAQKLWLAILEAQIETGVPYILFKDSCNIKSNQKNLGTIKSSNLCCEIVQYSSPEETAVCNLGSLALPSFVECNKEENVSTFNFEKLHSVTKVLTKNLDKIIDVTRYPVESTEKSNKRNRPIAIGVQGLADLFLQLRLPFDSQMARKLNIQIFETIYHASVEASMELAQKYGPYETFQGSPASEGSLQFDLWSHKPSNLFGDWDALKASVKRFGIRNSLLVGPMPTASTSQILGFNECFEPYTSNIYNRRVLSGEYQVVNKYLLNDLIDLGLWNSAMRNRLILENGSIQNIPSIPEELKALYKTVWEISQKTIIDMASERGKFIDQSQSMNIFLQNPTLGKLTSAHFYSWEKGLKTGMYYLRTQAASKAIQFTVDFDEAKKVDAEVAPEFTLKRNRYVEKDDYETDKDEFAASTKKVKRNAPSCPTPVSLSNSPFESPNPIKKIDIYDNKLLCVMKSDIENNCDSCSG